MPAESGDHPSPQLCGAHPLPQFKHQGYRHVHVGMWGRAQTAVALRRRAARRRPTRESQRGASRRTNEAESHKSQVISRVYIRNEKRHKISFLNRRRSWATSQYELDKQFVLLHARHILGPVIALHVDATMVIPHTLSTHPYAISDDHPHTCCCVQPASAHGRVARLADGSAARASSALTGVPTNGASTAHHALR